MSQCRGRQGSTKRCVVSCKNGEAWERMLKAAARANDSVAAVYELAWEGLEWAIHYGSNLEVFGKEATTWVVVHGPAGADDLGMTQQFELKAITAKLTHVPNKELVFMYIEEYEACCVDAVDSLFQSPKWAGAWESWFVKQGPNHDVGFQSVAHGTFLQAQADGGTCSHKAGWRGAGESWRIKQGPHGDIALQSVICNKYLHARKDGGLALADEWRGSWESWFKRPGPNGDIGLESVAHGTYLSAKRA